TSIHTLSLHDALPIFSFFPSISAGWRIDKERFFDQDNLVFDLLKIRGSYGALGNQNVPGEYPYIASMNAGQVSYILNGELPMGRSEEHTSELQSRENL